MGKNCRFGQASVFTEKEFNAFRKVVSDDFWRVFFEIAWYTGERVGAIRQLRVSDLYSSEGQPLDEIVFRAGNRKRDRLGRSETRSVPVSPTLKRILGSYRPAQQVFLFAPSGQDVPISHSAVDKALRRYLVAAGLDRGGFSTHSFRRSFITRLSEQGTDLRVIQQITGHRDIKSLAGYIEVSDRRVKQAIALLT